MIGRPIAVLLLVLAGPGVSRALAAARTVDLSALRNHDLFATPGKPAPEEPPPASPVYRMREVLPWSPPVPLAFDATDSPDVVWVKGADARSTVEIPVGWPARTLYILTAGHGGLDAKGIAADGEIRYADGRTQPLKWLVGEHCWPAWAGASGRSADPLPIGWNVGGDVLTASLLTVDLSFPDTAVASITVTARLGAMPLALLAVTTSDAAPVPVQAVADRATTAEWFDFRVPGELSSALPIDPAWAIRGPADKPISVHDGHLAYPDGSRARFWGINLVTKGALPSLHRADPFARSLAYAGFNLVRPHHMDPDGEGTLVNPLRGEPGQPLALPEALDRMDRFHAALKAAGVYTSIETWTARSFRPAEGVPAPQGIPVGNKYAAFIWPAYAEAKKAWVRALYDRVNPYTGLRYAEDPAVATVEIANEDSLLVAWNNGALERLPPAHRTRLDQLWAAWLRQTYGTDSGVAAAWKGPNRPGLQLGEALALESVAREPSTRGRADLYPAARAADLVRFYSGLEAGHHADMARFIREELGFTAPLVCNTSFGVPVADALLAACDIVDLHVYWDPIGETNVYFDHALIERPLHGRLIENLSWCQLDKPCMVSEINHTWPNQYGHEAPLLWASLAARQDLDAVVWFAYSHAAFDPAPDGPGGALDLAGRFSTWVQMPTASALFRSAAVAPPTRRYVRWWSPDGLLRDLAEPPGLWLDPQVSYRSILDNLLRTSFAPLPPSMVPHVPPPTLDPVRWWPEQGRYVVDTPTVQAIVGRTTHPILEPTVGRAPDASALRSVISRFSAVSLASLDGMPLGISRRALLTIAGRTDREGTLRSTGGPGLLVMGRGPARIERLRGFVDVRWPDRPVARELDPTGFPASQVAVQRLGDGWWRVATHGLSSPWVELRSYGSAKEAPVTR